MLFYLFSALVTLGSVMSRDAFKTGSPIPIITNSLVNLGKMDISFHFDAKDIPSPWADTGIYSSSSFFKPRLTVDEPCPCSSLKNFKSSLVGSPSDIINKIIRSNDLFSFNKNPVTSSMCCESHENVHEDIITFDMNPQHMKGNAERNNFFPFPLIFDNFISQKPYAAQSAKPTAIELFILPKKKDFGKFLPKKDSIQIVGDKDFKNNFSNLKLQPIVRPITSTVKKDLHNHKLEDQEKAKVTTTIANNPNVL